MKLPRAQDPCSEFDENGLYIINLSRTTFLLKRWDGLSKTYFPLKAKGSLTITQTRNLLLQSTNVAAHDYPSIFVLANQHQRHHVLRSVAARVSHANFKRFTKVVSAEEFEERLERAVQDPHTAEAKKFMRELLPLVSLAGQTKP